MSNQWDAAAPYTAEELHALYHGEGLSQLEIAERFGVRQSTVSRHMKRAGIQSRRAVARDQSGSKNNNWRGGRVLHARKPSKPNIKSSGYWYVWVPSHPNANKAGYVAEHIAVAAPSGIGKDQCVHHINLVKQDNRRENLVVLSRQTHADHHAQLMRIAGELVEHDVITYDMRDGYRLS
jgi:DNA-binding transcriptional ArsR family regulator